MIVFGVAAFVHVTEWPHRFGGGWLGVLTGWDGNWYRLIAERGYFTLPGRQSDIAFFPLLPALLRPFELVGIGATIGGLLVVDFACVFGLIAFYHVGRAWLDERDARRAAVYLAISPYSFVFSILYPESLLLLATTVAVLATLRHRWLLSGAALAAAALARPQGALAAVVVAGLVGRSWRMMRREDRPLAIAALLAAPAALAAYSAYLAYVVGNPFAWTRAEGAWGRSFSLTGPVRAFHALVSSSPHTPWLARDALFLGAYVVAVAVAARVVPAEWTLFAGLSVLSPVWTGSFASAARFGVVALPVYWGLAVIGRRPGLDRAYRVCSPVLLILGTLLLALRNP